MSLGTEESDKGRSAGKTKTQNAESRKEKQYQERQKIDSLPFIFCLSHASAVCFDKIGRCVHVGIQVCIDIWPTY